MEYILKVNASAVSRVGKFCAGNEDNFYVNGRYIYDREMDNVQVTVENSGSEYIFAVCDGMEKEIPEKGSSISVIKELKRLHDKFNRSEKEIEVKLEQFSECIEETNNLIYSAGLSNDIEGSGRAAFAGLLISGNRAAVLNISNCRVYLLRQGNLKLLSEDYKKAERLLKMGIITSEQAEELTQHFSSADSAELTEVKKSEVITIEGGEVFLLCTNGLTDAADEDRIFEILSTGEDSAYISNMLVKEAVKNGGEDNITALVVSIEGNGNENRHRAYGSVYIGEASEKKHLNRIKYKDESPRVNKFKTKQFSKLPKSSRRLQKAVQKFLSAAVACIVIAASLFGAYKLWGFLSKVEKEEDTMAQSTTQEEIVEESTVAEKETGYEEQVEAADSPDDEEGSSKQTLQFPVKYTVQKGDSLYQISRKFYNDHTKYKLIMQANNIEDPNHIKIGQVLIIPKP